MATAIRPIRSASPQATAPPPRSPERQSLAEAIAHHREARDALARVRAARERAPDVFDIAPRVEAAALALEEARAAEPVRLVAALLGEERAEGDTVAAAEAALRTAEGELEQARQIRDLLDERERSAALPIELAAGDVRRAVAEVLRSAPAVHRLLAEYRATQDRLNDLTACLGLVSSRDGIPEADRFWNAQRQWNIDKQPGRAPWSAAITALEADCDAALPGGPSDAPPVAG